MDDQIKQRKSRTRKCTDEEIRQRKNEYAKKYQQENKEKFKYKHLN